MLADHPEVIVLGEDLHDPYGGAFKVTAGLSTDFPGRVISTPISEAGVVGAAIGLALAGYRADRGDHVRRLPHAGDGSALQPRGEVPRYVRGHARADGRPHAERRPARLRPDAQSEPGDLMTAVPGLTVVFPSHRHDVGRLLEAATIDWGFPVVFFEHKLLYGVTQDRGDYQTVPAVHASDPGAALFPDAGPTPTDPDLTIVAYGGMLPIVEKVVAARSQTRTSRRARRAVAAQPLPRETLLRCAAGRGRVAIVEESPLGPGFGSELAAALLEQGFRGRLTAAWAAARADSCCAQPRVVDSSGRAPAVRRARVVRDRRRSGLH